MTLVTLGPGVADAIKSSLRDMGVQGPVRIEVRSSGCCDPSLVLMVDQPGSSDLVEEVDGMTFVMSPETRDLVGEVLISCAEETGKRGFVLTAAKPLSEWDGFAVQSIETGIEA